MNNNFQNTFWAIVVLTGLSMLAADFLLLIYFDYSFSQLIFRLGIPGLIFLAVYCAVLGQSAKYFNLSSLKESKPENKQADEYSDRLKKIGSVPIKMIALNVVIHAAFLGCVYINNGYLSIIPGMQGPLFLASLAFGMLVGTFIYVANDGLVSRTLIAQNFNNYPRELREKRQELKAMIIPMAAVLMALIFACSVTMLSIIKAGGSINDFRGGDWVILLIPVIIVFICVSILSINLKKNASTLYSSIIEQLENLSSDQKDLRKRITVC